MSLLAELGVDPMVAEAVAQVESGGIPPVIGIWPVMRIELHNVWRRWPATHRKVLDHYIHIDGPRPWEGHRILLADQRIPQGAVIRGPGDSPGHSWVKLHAPKDWRIHQLVEQVALQTLVVVASGIVPGAAQARAAVYESASYGRFQLMGWDHALYGYHSAEQMAEALRRPDAQVEAFAKRLKGNPAELAALRGLDWFRFARHYNGPGQPEWYADRMARAYRALLVG